VLPENHCLAHKLRIPSERFLKRQKTSRQTFSKTTAATLTLKPAGG
jgi:hypothetical protein